MTQIILVLEENIAIQLVIAVSLKEIDITIHKETDPDLFVQRTSDLKPDLIFLSNSDSERDYKVCREIRAESDLINTPIILLANAKDEVDEHLLSELDINGLLRKPFEASMLREQLSPFITLDENFGSEPYENDEDFLIDMSTIDNQLKEIKQGTKASVANGEEEPLQMDGLKQSASGMGLGSSPGSHMDSIILDNHQLIQEQPDSVFLEKELAQDENEMSLDILEESAEAEMNAVVGKIPGVDEEPEQKLRAGLTEIDLAVNDFEDPSEILARSPDMEQSLREGLTDISLDQTDFQPEYPKNISSFEARAETESQDMAISEDAAENWSELDDYELKQSTDENELEPESPFDNMLLSDSVEEEKDLDMDHVFEFDLEPHEDGHDANSTEIELSAHLVEAEPVPDGLEQLKYSGLEDQFAESRLTESRPVDFEEDVEIEDVEQFVYETSEDEFEEALDLDQDDAQINSMVHDSLNGHEDGEESALGELEELSGQMEALESDETEFEAEEEFEDDLEKEEIESASIAGEGIMEVETDSEEYLADIMVEELGDLLEEDDTLDAEDRSEDGIVGELKETVIDGLVDLEDDDADFETETYSETSPEVHEEVFESWDEAEDAFMKFDREKVFDEKGSGFAEIDEIEFDNLDEDNEDIENSESYGFTEKELKEIVTVSVQKALEKSIATSLVELAVSELKSQVTQMDQSLA